MTDNTLEIDPRDISLTMMQTGDTWTLQGDRGAIMSGTEKECIRRAQTIANMYLNDCSVDVIDGAGRTIRRTKISTGG